jgi:bacillithiol biosynthesis cysteine-adding enzyme BshC
LAGGPLYLLYKIITTIKVAERIEAVPIFWNASDDNDWKEVCTIHFFEKGAVQKVCMHTEEKSSFGLAFPKEEAEEVLHSLSKCFEGREHARWAEELMCNSFKKAETFSQWSSAILLSLFGEWGLVIVDPCTPGVKESVRWIFEEEIKEPLLTTALLMEEGERLKKAGYKPKIHKRAESCSLFLIEEGERVPLYYKDEEFFSKKRKYKREQLLSFLKENCARFSPNVALRAIMQDVLLSPHFAILGPSELAYYQQLRGVYRRYSVKTPSLLLRLSVTLLESHIADFLKHWKIMPSQIFAGTFSNTVAAKVSPAHDEAFKRARESMEAAFLLLEGVDDALRPYFSAKKASVQNLFDKMHKKVHAYIKKREEGFLQKIESVKEYIRPLSLPQERVLSMTHFLSRYGSSFIKKLFDLLPLDSNLHYFLAME